MRSITERPFLQGLKDGLPIGLGYISVSFSLGIYAKAAGLSPSLGFISSVINHASAGEYSGYVLMAASATFAELALMMLIANLRYLLMSSSLSQRIPEQTGTLKRLFLGFLITDEIFAAAISRKGEFSHVYTYGLAVAAIPLWALGTALGIIVGNVLPIRFVSALGVALYGMFLAVIIPRAKADRKVALFIGVSFAVSLAVNKLSLFSGISDGIKIIFVTILVSGLAAAFCPVEQEADDE